MILGLIPARGGSKGVPRKNLRPCAGRPLIAWTIQAAHAATLLDRFVVSTEDAEVAEVAASHGAVVLARPAALATDEATTEAVMQHALDAFPDATTLVLLQPTSPIRDTGLIDRCIRDFIAADADSAATGFVCRYLPYGTPSPRRQDIAGFFYDDGSVYVIRAALVRGGDRFGSKHLRIETDREQNLDIDDEFDFGVAEMVLRRRCGFGPST